MENSVEFWTLAVDSKWNDEALQGAFLNGLNEVIKDELATRDEPEDPEKIRALMEWPTPTTRKQLQQFLGFANFYRRFIKGFSSVVAPLTRLTSPKVPFLWSPEAEQAVGVLKELFSISPVLIHPKTSLQFIVEVDVSDLDVGAVLSQRSPTNQRLHPCAFFSKKLSPTERNYDVGNRELLAIWLDGAEQPFVVWTDHKNLAYIQATKRLNFRQASWALFFSRFNFILTYRPGSRNIKPDALSRQFADPSETGEPEAVLPSSCVVAAVQWDIESLVKAAYPGPGTGPPDLLFVPETLRSQVLQ